MSSLARSATMPHVAAERQVHPCSDSRAVDGGERRQRTAGDAQEPFVDRAQAVARRLGEVAEIGAGAERRWRAGHHDGADAVVGLERFHRGDDLRHHRGGERVAFVRIVERERADAVSDVGEDEPIGRASLGRTGPVLGTTGGR